MVKCEMKSQSSFLHHFYSYLPNKWGDSNKRAGWHFPTNGQGGKNILIHKKACQGWKISQNEINGYVEGGIFF